MGNISISIKVIIIRLIFLMDPMRMFIWAEKGSLLMKVIRL
jgi:hypothetical protein